MIQPFEKPVYVTKPFLPSIDEYKNGLRKILDTAWLTSNGPVLRRYTKLLEEYFQTENIYVLKVARRTARQILTLPIYDALKIDDAHRICDTFRPSHSTKRQS